MGEVWLASGQSNMLFRLNQTSTAKEDIAASGDEQITYRAMRDAMGRKDKAL